MLDAFIIYVIIFIPQTIGSNFRIMQNFAPIEVTYPILGLGRVPKKSLRLYAVFLFIFIWQKPNNKKNKK